MAVQNLDKKYKILNLYACLGGNRYKWNEVSEDIDVVAVELDPVAATLYKERFPSDTVVVADAHEYLLNNYLDFDFIWSSPPCPTHSRARISQINRETFIPKYPDMKLYEEIIFLQHHFKGKFCVENVIPYYQPLIAAKKRGRHLYWTNFNLPNDLGYRKIFKNMINKGCLRELSVFHDYDFNKYNGKQSKIKMARNLVDFEVGRSILGVAMNINLNEKSNQTTMF